MSRFDTLIDDEYRVSRPPQVRFTIDSPVLIEHYMTAFRQGAIVEITTPQWCGAAFIVQIDVKDAIDGRTRVEVTGQGTGRPYASVREQITIDIMNALRRMTGNEMIARTEAHRAVSACQYAMIAKQESDIRANYKAMREMTTPRPFLQPALEATAFGIDWMFTKELAAIPQQKEKTMKKVRNKFYVAAPNVTTNSEQDQINDDTVRLSTDSGDRNGKWTRPTLPAAIAHAETILEKEPNRDHVAIVQIVRIVRRKKLPAVVEVVR